MGVVSREGQADSVCGHTMFFFVVHFLPVDIGPFCVASIHPRPPGANVACNMYACRGFADIYMVDQLQLDSSRDFDSNDYCFSPCTLNPSSSKVVWKVINSRSCMSNPRPVRLSPLGSRGLVSTSAISHQPPIASPACGQSSEADQAFR